MAVQPRKQIRRLQRFVPVGDSGITILAYHLVGAGTASVVDVPKRTFVDQMAELRERARVVALPEALRWLEGESRLYDERDGRPIVVLTFDDAYANFVDVAFPVLRGHGFPATLYVPTDFIERAAEGPLSGATELPPCTWSDLRRLLDSGLITIGSHTCSHVNLPGLPPEELERELQDSKLLLQRRLSAPVEGFCFPRAQWDAESLAAVRRHYRHAVVAGGGKSKPGTYDPHALERVPIRRDMPSELLPIIRGAVWLEEWFADRFRRYAS